MSSNTEFTGAPATGGSDGEGRGGDRSRVPPRPLATHPITDSVRRIKSAEDLRRVCLAAKTDNHAPIAPTHLAERDGEVIGYASIGLVPLVFIWVHTQKVRARESFALLAKVQEEAKRVAPAGIICVPCGFDSPFYKYMTKLDFVFCGNGGIYIKNLNHVPNT